MNEKKIEHRMTSSALAFPNHTMFKGRADFQPVQVTMETGFSKIILKSVISIFWKLVKNVNYLCFLPINQTLPAQSRNWQLKAALEMIQIYPKVLGPLLQSTNAKRMVSMSHSWLLKELLEKIYIKNADSQKDNSAGKICVQTW